MLPARVLLMLTVTAALSFAQTPDGGCQGELKTLAATLHSIAPVPQALMSNAYAAVGSFAGRPVTTEWEPDGRLMKVIKDLEYTDPCGTIWDAPPGSITDGASIPKWAWSFIGGPYEARYRDAAVIHDVACEQKTRSWKATHEMFYFAMLAAGGLYDSWQTKVMFAAVYHFGPRWPDPALKTAAPVSQMTRDQFKTLASQIKMADALAPGSKEGFSLAKAQTDQGAGNVNSRITNLDNYLTAGTATVYFKTNSSALTPEVKQQLDGIAQKAQLKKDYVIAVAGFGDTTGKAEKNQTLSGQRADSVIQYLEQQGHVSTHRIISPTDMGTSPEAASNDTAAGRKMNRRVEVKLLAHESEQSTVLSQIENWQPSR